MKKPSAFVFHFLGLVVSDTKGAFKEVTFGVTDVLVILSPYTDKSLISSKILLNESLV